MNLNLSAISLRGLRQSRKMIEDLNDNVNNDDNLTPINSESHDALPDSTAGTSNCGDGSNEISTEAHDRGTALSTFFPDKSKPSLLCLHGYKSNGQITMLQLENLAMGKNFDVHVLHGPIESDTPAEANMDLLSSGPYYSWMQMDSTRTNSDHEHADNYNNRHGQDTPASHVGPPPDIFSAIELRNKQPNFAAMFHGMNNKQHNEYQPCPTTMEYTVELQGNDTVPDATNGSADPSDATPDRRRRSSNNINVLGVLRRASMDLMKNKNTNNNTPSRTIVPTGENSLKSSNASLGQLVSEFASEHNYDDDDDDDGNGDNDINNKSATKFNNTYNTSLQIPDAIEDDGRQIRKCEPSPSRNLLPKMKKLRRGSSLGSNDQNRRDSFGSDGLKSSYDDSRRDNADAFKGQNERLRGQFDETMSALRYLLQHLVLRTEEKRSPNFQNDNNINNDTGGVAEVNGTSETQFKDDSPSSSGIGGEETTRSEDNDDEVDDTPAYDAVYAFSQAASLVSIISNSVMRRRLMQEFELMSPYPEQASKEEIIPWKFVILGCAANSTAYTMVRWYLFEHHVCHPVLVVKRDRAKKMVEAQLKLQEGGTEEIVTDDVLQPERRNSPSNGSQNDTLQTSYTMANDQASSIASGRQHRSRSLLGAMSFSARKLKSDSVSDATTTPETMNAEAITTTMLSSDTARASSFTSLDQAALTVENTDVIIPTCEAPRKQTRRSSFLGVMRRLSASSAKVPGETDFELTPTNDDLHKVLAVEEGICDKCGEELKKNEGFNDLIDIPSVQFIGIEDDLKSESEYYLLQYKSESVMPIYLDSGHEIPVFLKSVDSIAEDIMLWRELKGLQRDNVSIASLTTLGEESIGSDTQSDNGFENAPPSTDSGAPLDKFDNFESAPPPTTGTHGNPNKPGRSAADISNSDHSRRRFNRRSTEDMSNSNDSRHRTSRRGSGKDISQSERSHRFSQRGSEMISRSEHSHRISRRGSTTDISNSDHSRCRFNQRRSADHVSNSNDSCHRTSRRGSGRDISQSERSHRFSQRGSEMISRSEHSHRMSRRGSTTDMSNSEHIHRRFNRRRSAEDASSTRSERVIANLQGNVSKIFTMLEERLDDNQDGFDRSSRHRRSSIGSVSSIFLRKKERRKHDIPQDVSLVRVNNDMIYFHQNRQRGVKNLGLSPDFFEDETEDKIDVPLLGSLVPHAQYFLNNIEFSEPSTLFDLLSEADNTCSPALYSPIEQGYCMSYLEILSFIRTHGDLRRLDAKKNSLVAYTPPPGAGGIISALAFLTIAAQCTAAPMDPSYSRNDYDAAFEQLNPDIMIVFEPVDPKPVLEAASQRNCKCYIASPTSDGYFTYHDALTMNEMPFVKSSAEDGLVNEADGVGLLLRTSGTTSKPKVVPLKIGSIVSNARVIAQSLGLQSSDVSLNAMPLFHIGGISANLLSSLASSGGCILAETFDPDSFNTLLASETCGIKPTWFSAVPTMHATITATAESLITLNAKNFQHSLRFIRSGAAALSHDLALKMESVFLCPVVGTYSMTEQMPISQPHNLREIRHRSVGKPLATSLCIVDKNLRPLPFGFEQHGEVCISGDPVFEGYQGNDTANMKSFFFIGSMKWFRTGDMGYLDREGYLFLTGRNKEMIKRGGEQINPLEVEEICKGHPMIKTCVAFAIPDKLWGQRLGLAVVKDSCNSSLLSEDDLVCELKQRVIKYGLQELKAPEKVVFLQEQDIPMTSSKKVIRVGLSEKLGVKPMSDDVMERLQDLKPFPSISEALSGVRFFLAFAVLYNHIGDFGDRLNHARLFCLHVPAFFFIGGFILAAGSKNNVIDKADLKGFFGLRLAIIHPMYLIALVFALINFVVRCKPSNYIEDFDPVRQPEEGEHFVCQSTMIEMPYGWAMFSSLFMHIFALQPWPFSLLLSWFILSYPWFQSVYYFCLFCFPWLHRQFHAQRRNKKGLFKHMVFWLCSNYIMVGVFQLYSRLYEYDPNFAYIFSLMAYLFPPGWLPSFALGVGAYFLFALYRPNEKMSVWKWGIATDCLTLGIFTMFMVFAMLPEHVTPDKADTKEEKRYFAYFLSRVTAPITFLWIFGLAVGKGLTARLMSNSFLVTWLAPASYNMYLFHQIIQEWYFLATRGYWWVQPKPYYWFSPYATPVPWWEFFIIAFITIAFSVFVEVFINGWIVKRSTAFTRTILCLKEEKVDGKNVGETIVSVIKNITGMEVFEDTNLLDTGLSSMTTLLLVSDLVKIYPTLKLTARDVFGAKTVKGLIDVVEEHLKESVVPTSGMDGFRIEPNEER